MDVQDDRVVTTMMKVLRKRRKFESDLPTPPPDPQDVTEQSASLPSPGVTTSAVAALNAEDAFQHLTRLYTLVEQILNLRDKNSTLFRRVRQLEKTKTLKNATCDLEKCQDLSLLDEDVGFAESLLGAMLSNSVETPRRSSNISRASSSARRGPGQFTAGEQRRVSCPVAAQGYRTRSRTSTLSSATTEVKKRPPLILGQPKISKWTRVKAAFKWEKAACNPTETSNDPEINVKYLRPPEQLGGSSEASGPTTPIGTISSSSSIDDVFHSKYSTSYSSRSVVSHDYPRFKGAQRPSRIGRQESVITDKTDQDPSRRSRSLDGEVSLISMNFGSIHPRTKDSSNAPKIECRMHRTPWGKMKDIMQLRKDISARQGTRRSQNDDNQSTSSLDSTDIHRPEHETRVPQIRLASDSSLNLKKPGLGALNTVDLATRRLTPTLTITVPSSEELRSIPSPESVTPAHPRPLSESGRSDKSSVTGDGSKDKSGQASPVSLSSGVHKYGLESSRISARIPRDLKRQQSLKGESLGSSPKMQRRDSKWNKVKRAFLTSATSVPTSPSRISSYFFDDGETAESYSASASAEDLDDTTNPTVQAEIQRNYRLLHDKLDTEFYRKLTEWEKLKSSSTSSNPKDVALGRSSIRERDTDNLRLLGGDRLTPEFKKKLEEWKRMGKTQSPSESRTISRRRITDWQLWRLPTKADKVDGPGRLSEDFIRKMEEWKRIKAAAKKDDDHDIRRPEIEKEKYVVEEEANIEEEIKQTTNDLPERFKSWKGLENEEFKSLETVLSAMEADRQTRLSKLHRVVGSAPATTQEVLIHTSTGFFRFEGISRKFTRRLYEWEKSQGIAPELSTFRLLDPLRYGISSNTRTASVNIIAEERPQRSLSRCKSVGSVHTDAWSNREDRPLIRPPSSLSLNDMECLETRSCLIASSVPTIDDEEDTFDDIVLEDFELEPGAMIVDIEDVIEETASPMTKLQPHQTPIYSVAGSETTSIAIPLGTVTARHEPSPVILIEPGETHPMLLSTMEEITLKSVQSPEDNHQPKSIMNPVSSFATSSQNQTKEEDEDDALSKVVITVASNSRSKRQVLKTRRLTDSQVGYDWQTVTSENSTNKCSPPSSLSTVNTTNDDFLNTSNHEKIIINENTLNKIVVPTSSGTLTTTDTIPRTLILKKNDLEDTDGQLNVKKDKRDPRSVFIKTKRIVFSPFRREVKEKLPESTSTHPSAEIETSSASADASKHEYRRLSVPRSPIPTRKEYKTPSPKETAPSIRMMIKKYNEKLESSSGCGITAGSTTSSGSGSPIWRSPVRERRIRDRMEKYQEEVRKAIAGPMYRFGQFSGAAGITKSATVDFAPKNKTPDTINPSVMKSGTSPEIPRTRSLASEAKDWSSTATQRTLMLQKAKIDFLSSSTNDSAASKVKIIVTKENPNDTMVDKDALRNISRPELVRSVSAGMINVDSDTFERLQATTKQNCDSPPKSSDHLRHQIDNCNKECTSRFHQLTVKFKRARLRKTKDKDFGSMSTVSMLCRQSLLVDIAETSKSCPTTPSPQHENESRTLNTSRKIV